MADREPREVSTSTSWEGLHITCNADQALWLWMALDDARRSIAKREHAGTGNHSTYDALLESADQWKFYEDMADRAISYASEKNASRHGVRWPDGRHMRCL